MRRLAYAALWVFVFSLGWQNVVVIPGVGAASRLIGMLAIALAFLATVISGRLRRWHVFHVAALLFVVWTGSVLLVVSYAPKLPNKFYTYAQLLMLVWMVWEIAPSRRDQLRLLAAYVFGAYVAALNTIVASRMGTGARRFAATGFDPNELAMTLALALPAAWYLGMMSRQPLLRWACRGYLPVGLLALGLTGSRGGVLASTVGLLIVPLTLTRLSPGRLVAGLVLLGLSSVLAVAYIPETAMERLATTGTELEGGTLGGRVRIWRAGVLAFTQRPVVGYGVGTFPHAVERILGVQRASHNSFLTVLVEQGLVGFSLYATMFGVVFLAVLGLPPLERRFGLVLLATLLIAMLPLPWEDSKPAWFILSALLGLAQSADTQERGSAGALVQGRAYPAAGSSRAPQPWAPLASPTRTTRRHDIR